ncbi:glycosyltransferase [bacterium]|nr:glycosyltransferase [bacterium]
MPDLPGISIIVPVYNGEKTIAECLESLLALDFPKESFEIICVDNDSTDKTSAILHRYGERIRILHEKKRGPSAARNRGLRNATGDVIAFTDADCTVAQDWLRNLILPLENSDAAVVGGRILSKQPCNHIEKFGENIHDHSKAIELYRPPYAITMNWASRASILRELEFFDENLLRCEDVDLSYRLFQKGYRFVFSPDAIVYHRNEDNYWGLTHEGFLHGYYSVPVLKKHDWLLKQFGHRRWNKRTYVDLASSFVESIRGNERKRSRCQLMFNSGKKAGKIVGSIRYRYVDL